VLSGFALVSFLSCALAVLPFVWYCMYCLALCCVVLCLFDCLVFFLVLSGFALSSLLSRELAVLPCLVLYILSCIVLCCFAFVCL
jgi:hypothetical protein